MKKFVYTLLTLLIVTVFVSCNKYETYGEKKERERNAIAEYIRSWDIKVITESEFAQNGNKTDVEKNEYVYLTKSGIYLQIIREGCGSMLEEKKLVGILCRFEEFNILEDTVQLSNMLTSRTNYLDKMNVTRTGTTFTGSFERGVMMSAYGSASVPNAFMIPLSYIKIGRPQEIDDETAKVKMIVPHTQGQSDAQQKVYPCVYTITMERED
jgi:hypothetical protein